MNLRRLSADGITQFGQYLAQLKTEPTQPPPMWLLDHPTASEPVADVEVAPTIFANRLAAAKYLDSLITAAGLTGVERDVGLWAWLSLFFFEQVCPLEGSRGRDPGALARFIPEIAESRRYYRHLLLGPFMMYSAHRDNPERLQAHLCDKITIGTSETYRLFIENPALIACNAAVETATLLYYDPDRGRVRRGTGTKGGGGCRRLIQVLQQFDCTFDLPMLSRDRLLDMLPQEFSRFVPQQMRLIG